VKKLFALFFELFKISLFVIGGGYAIIAVADQVFAKKGWTEEGEIIGKLPIFQMVPGLIATHVAVYVGGKVAGAVGAALGVAAVAVPSVVIFTFVSAGYDSLPLDGEWLKAAFVGLRSALTGIIAATIFSSWRKSLPDLFSYAVMAACAFAIAFLKVDVASVLLAAMAAGVVRIYAGAKGNGGTVFRSTWLPLFLFLKFGVLCFGGGFVLVPMYIESFVGESAPFLQISDVEFANLMALTQMTPGPIGVNGATFFGYRLAGVAGALAASALLLLPGSLLIYAALRSLEKFAAVKFVRGILCGAKPASVALMTAALWVFAGQSVATGGVASLILVAAAFVLVWRKVCGAMAVIALSALAGCILYAMSLV
jgi:chromate transporter